MSHSHLSHYELSGEVNPASFPMILLKGVIGAIILGALYAAGIFYVPFIYILCFFTVAFGVALGSIMVHSMVKGEVRNRKTFLVFSFLAACIGIYAHWVIWLIFYGESLILNPIDLLEKIGRVGKNGVWSFEGWTPAGTSLYSLWGLEALTIIAISLLASLRSFRELVYCENCKKWLEKSEKESLIYSLPKEEAMQRVRAGDFEAIKALRPYKNSKSAYELEDPSIRLVLEQCTRCKTLRLLSLFVRTPRLDSEGELHYDEEPILEKVLAPESLFKALSNA